MARPDGIIEYQHGTNKRCRGLAAAQTRDVYYDYVHALGLQTKARFDGLDGYGVTNYFDAFGQPTTTLLTMDGQPGHFATSPTITTTPATSSG